MDSFLDKNKDQLYADLVHMLSSSSIPLIKTLFGDEHQDPNSKDRAVKSLGARGAGARGGGAGGAGGENVGKVWILAARVLSLRFGG